jgi:CRISPR/Cas system CSM-associated protein Csm2 small subunit
LRARFKTKVRNIISREGKKCEWKDITAKGARLWLNNVLLNDLNRRELESNKNLVECLPPVIDMVA